MRDRQLSVYNEIIDDVYLRYSKDSIDIFIQQIGLSNDAMNTREGKRRFVYALLNQNDNGRMQWEEIELVKSQYSGDALLEQLTYRFRNYNNDPHCLGILGVTSNDIYENDYNFLFGWAQKSLGIISYARFLLGNPTNEQFEKRTIMQALSSIGFVIGIPRCTNPTCARAYPNSLEEQDRKNDKLCNESRENLRKLYLTLK
jgi:predicted Zn-dependent protease